MATKQFEIQPVRDPEGQLERALIDEFLRTRGHDLRSIQGLPTDQKDDLLRRASLYAAARLAEVGARAHFVHELEHED
jgi:hypothetical protein